MTSSKSYRFPIKHLDKILFGVACAYLIAILGWLFNQHQVRSNPEISQNSPPSASDAQFIAYLQQSLNILDRKSNNNIPVPPTNTNASVVPISPPAPVQEKVIERIYIPMYPPNQSSATAVTPVTPPPKPSPINRIPPPPPLPSAVSPPTRVPVLAPGQIVLPIPPQTAANSLPTANPSHILVGLLESGSQSTALFTFNGMTRRFAVGESIGGSGWVLIAVQNQTVVVSNNDKTKYLEVGQGF